MVEDGWAMFLIGDDLICSQKVVFGKYKKGTGKAYSNIALTYLVVLKWETHVLGATKDEAVLHSQTFTLNNTESDVTTEPCRRRSCRKCQ